jgi:membrane-bound lytic murein transglycosylase B
VASFTAAGWKAGDKAGWEQHLKARMQNSQNDYTKVN